MASEEIVTTERREGPANDGAGARNAEILARIARKMASAPRPAARSEISSGSACLAVIAARDLAVPGASLDLGLIYGAASPRGTDGVAASESCARSVALIAQVQLLWLHLHNTVAGVLVGRAGGDTFEMTRAIVRGIYRDAIRSDIVGAWMMPALRGRYLAAEPRRIDASPFGPMPGEYANGVARLAAALLRDVAPADDDSGPRDDADWLAGFGRHFKVGSSVPQRARAIGPRSDEAILGDLTASTRGCRSLGTLIQRCELAEPGVLEGSFAMDARRRTETLRAWLADIDLGADEADRLSAEPPLLLYLMLEAEAETSGRTLGSLGSLIVGETVAAAMPESEADPAVDAARTALFGGRPPASTAEMLRFLWSRVARRATPAGLAA